MEAADALASAQLSRYDALLGVSKTLAGHRTMAELFDVLAGRLHSVVPFDYLALIVHDEPTGELRLVVLEPTDMTPPFVARSLVEEGPAATVWKTQKGAVIPIPEEGALPPGLEFIRSQGRKMTCWLPLTTARRRVGVLGFGSCLATVYTDDILAFMEQVAATVAIAVDNGINYDEAQRFQRELREERDQLRFLLEVNNLLVSQLNYPELPRAISDALQRVVRHDHVSVARFEPDTGLIQIDWVYDATRGLVRSDLSFPVDGSAAGTAFQRGAVTVFRRSELEALGPDGASMGKAGLASACCVPLATRNGKVGVLTVGSVKPDAFSDDIVALLANTAMQIAIAVENAGAYERLTLVNAQLSDEKRYLERELQQEFSDIVGTSPALLSVLNAVKTVAPTDTTVLLLGETGTGKELLARAIHDLSPRRERTFVRTSVAALPSSLLESELFGHEKGAFTGATTSRAGRLELAHRGTLFLDEVGDIPLDVQPKLLRVLQEREFERLGSTRTQRVDVRIVAATNRDLEQMVDEGTFRSDLYYRLSVFPIVNPPLRERVEDIPALALHFAGQCARRVGRPVPSIPDPVMRALTQWSWPGNIRELQNVIERAVILSKGPQLTLAPQDVQPKTPRRVSSVKAATTFNDAERESILRALRESGGVIAGPTGAAARLGLNRTTLHSKMQRLGIQRPSY